ncbi:MAG: hypothetical protein AB9846_06945 [Tenuifilaceae bacterium]
MRLFALSILLLLALISCKKEDISIINDENLIGIWAYPVYNDSIITFNRSGNKNIDSYRLSILENGKLIERKNSGWCGTPPISYADFEGNWNLTDSILTISVGFWGGTEVHQWQVKQLNNKNLIVKTLGYFNNFKP